MRSLLLNNLRAHARRYVATGVAIAISVAFVLAALSFGVAIKDSLSQGVRDTYEGSSVVIDVSGGDITDQQLAAASDTVRGVDGVNAVIVQRVTYLELSHNGKRLGASVKSGNLAPLHQPKLSEGTMPSDSGTIAIPTSTADALGLKVGDKVHVATAMSSESMDMDLTVSGLVDAGGLLSNATAVTNDQNALEGGYVSKVFVIANQGVDASELTTRIAAKLGRVSYLGCEARPILVR
ncbi:ABC transporter permease [Changpingibacter yushuensis]|uniref:ABC transporter permease n=1 Tax=Changpingibacter yushuensis TaxID=2758440 RepID=UPI0015F68053|nr:ABC transporter permease [Changpingibacter yushuensis]